MYCILLISASTLTLFIVDIKFSCDNSIFRFNNFNKELYVFVLYVLKSLSELSSKVSLLFSFNINLQELNLSSFNTNNVTNMFHTFNSCKSLKRLDLRKAIFTSVSNYDDIFALVPSDINIITKDTTTKSWLEDRLKGKGTVTIG